MTPPSAQQQQIFDTGNYVGETACRLFPGGVEIPFDITDLPGMSARTKELIDEGISTIYEASFIYDDVFVAVDILHYENGLWNIYEVKSSTGVKEIYIHDTAVQTYVLENCGIKLKSENIIHINNKYIRGTELDLNELFTITDISLRVLAPKRLIPEKIKDMKALLEGTEPEQEIGPRCLSPYECFARDYCWKNLAGIPDDSVFSLTSTRMDDKFKYFSAGTISLNDLNPAELGKAQQLQIEGNLHIEEDPIREFLSTLDYPISHLDFESFQQAVPEYEGVKPYQQIPFQYSLHIEDGINCIHKEFLGPWDSDPRRELAENLIKDIPEEGSILAYNRSFERGVINKLAALYPDIEKELTSISERISDLMLPFQKRWYYHPEMKGSYSIKKVLPALVPEMEKAYAELPGVKNGGEASTIWLYLSTSKNAEEQEKIRQGLLEYCKLDTLAMVKILEILRTV